MREVLLRLLERLDAGHEVLLTQVVETRGSTPQKAGALMLVEPDGGQVGTLGGGCVEAEVKQKSIRRLGQPGAERHTFVLDHDYAWADGLICGGRMTILAEALQGEPAARYVRARLRLLDDGSGSTEVVAVDPEAAGWTGPVGARWLFDASGTLTASYPPGLPAEVGAGPVVALDQRPRPSLTRGLAALPTLPRIRLLIIGAGHVGQAVAALASQADFEVWVADDRRQYANPDRIPAAARHIVCPIDDLLRHCEITTQTYGLIVTRGHGHDQEALQLLVPTVAPYVGLIGSRRKIRMIFEALRAAGIAESDLARVSAPVGVNIGSESVTEIAISIVAELVARRNLGQRGAVGNAFTEAEDVDAEAAGGRGPR